MEQIKVLMKKKSIRNVNLKYYSNKKSPKQPQIAVFFRHLSLSPPIPNPLELFVAICSVGSGNPKHIWWKTLPMNKPDGISSSSPPCCNTLHAWWQGHPQSFWSPQLLQCPCCRMLKIPLAWGSHAPLRLFSPHTHISLHSPAGDRLKWAVWTCSLMCGNKTPL